GYLGGGLLFAVNVVMVTQPALFGLAYASQSVRWSFVSGGGWWWACTIPPLLFVKDPRTAAPLPFAAAVRAGMRELANTLAHLRRDKTLLRFLLAYWFYIDGVNTII